MAIRRTEEEKPAAAKHCAYNDHGMNCGQPGFLSLATHGEGPWYCRKHFASIMGWPDQPAVREREETQADIDARVERLVPRQGTTQDWSKACRIYALKHLPQTRKQGRRREWARRIMDRIADGERLPMISVDMARAVLPAREPGED